MEGCVLCDPGLGPIIAETEHWRPAVSLRFLVVCSGPRYSHTYPDGSRIDHVAALYEATRVEGDLRADGSETLGLGYFAVGSLPRMQPLSRLLLERALGALSA